MDKHYIKTFQELSNMQSKIASLFEDLLIERYQYKLSSDKLKKNLEEISIEVKNLKKQNEKLHQGNQELKSVICECLKVFKHLDFSEANLVKDRKIIIDTLKKMLAQANSTIPELVNINDTVNKELTGIDKSSIRCNINEDDIVNDIDAIKDLKFTTQFFDNVEINKEKEVLNKMPSGMGLEKIFDRKSSKAIENFGEVLLVRETEPFEEKDGFLGPVKQETVDFVTETEPFGEKNGMQETVEPLNEVTIPKESLLNSPAFKNPGARKQESVPVKDRFSDDSKSKLISHKLFAKCSDLIVSPLKKPDMHNCTSPKRDISPLKRSRKKLRIDSPKKSPSQLKKSNSREAEITVSGVRKLTQTLLNIECFKKNSPEKRRNGENVENKDKVEPTSTNETRVFVEFDEDDVIMDSPRKFEQVLEGINVKKKTETALNQMPLMTTPTTSDADLDETYVSASIIKKCQDTSKHIFDKLHEDQTPVKRPDRERSLNDSVPFFYKGEVVRSKAERMKLPGHACPECNKYYKNALGEDVSPERLQEILNKCSRHRDKNPPSLDDTPCGYWKPFLTLTVTSPHKETLAVSSNQP